MTFDELAKKLTKAGPDIQDKATRMAAETAVSYFQNSFRRKAFDGEPWVPTKKKRGSTLVASSNLLHSVRVAEVRTGYARFSAGNDKVQYARVHNEGFNDLVYVRSHTRKHWKTGTVYTVRAFQRHMRIIKRQYMGDSREMNKMIVERMNILIKKLLK